jgi:outer membrane protein insertion porin family
VRKSAVLVSSGLRRDFTAAVIARVSRAALVALVWLAATTATYAQPAADGPARVYVRRIEFVGVTRTDDETLRRELTQLEGTFVNTVELERSRQRLERLPFIANARVALRPVGTTPDVVDVVISIEEAPARRYGGGGGYSESLRTSLYGYYSDDNWLGKGQRIAVQVEGSDLRRRLDVLHTVPYVTPDGTSRTVALSANDIDQLTVDSSPVHVESASARLEYGLRLAGRDIDEQRATEAAPACFGPNPHLSPVVADRCVARLRVGVDARVVDLATTHGSSSQWIDWIAEQGGAPTSQGFLATKIREADWLLGWNADLRDADVFASRGAQQTLSVRAALPGSDAEYVMATYEAARYWPVGATWTFDLRGNVGLGVAYGATPSLPPYQNFFAGGPNTVRGFRDGGLGPRDSLGRPYGGNLLAALQLEAMAAWPSRWRDRVRVGFFYDVGNVFSTEDVKFADEQGQPLDYGFKSSDLRRSYGLALHVRVPLGLLRISYGEPLNARESASVFHRDEVEHWQLSLGVQF